MGNEIKAINEAIALVNKLEGEVESLEARVLSLSDSSLKAGKSVTSIKSPKDLSAQLQNSKKLSEELTTIYQKQQITINQLKKQVDALKKARTGSGKAATEEERQLKRLERSQIKLKQSYSDVERQIIRNQQRSSENRRNIRREESLYGRISIKLKKTAEEYKEISLKKQLFNNISEKEERRLQLLEKRIDKYRGALVKADERTGNFSKNVGNYKSGFDGLGNSVNQLTRELPAFTNSAQTGFLAISNNIPTLVDEINRLRSANKALASEGKPTKNVLTQLGSAIFSWQTAISIGITLLTVYGAELVEMAFGLSEAEKRQQKLNEAVAKGNAEAKNASAELRTLKSIVTDTTASEKAREGALTQLKDTVVELRDVELDQAGAMEKIISLTDQYIEATEARAKADAFAQLAAETEAEIIRRKAASLQDEAKWYDFVLSAVNNYGNGVLASTGAFERASKRRSEGLDSEQKFLTAVNDKVKEYLQKSFELEDGLKGLEKGGKKANKIRKDEVGVINELIDTYENLIKAQKNNVLFNESSTVQEVENAIQKIKELRKDIENLQLGILEDEKIISIPIDFEVPEDNEIVQLLDNVNKKLKGQLDDLKASNKATFEEIAKDAVNYINQIVPIFRSFAQAKLQRYDDEIQKNNEFYANVLASERFSEEERSQIEAQREAKEEQIRKRKIQEERRQAIFEKALAISKIAINTAVAVSKVLDKPFLIAATIGLGLAQTAAVIATPIPQYEFGKPTSDNYEGNAIWGEKRREVKYNPNTGRIEVSPNKPTLTNVKKDDIIYPSINAFNRSMSFEDIDRASLMTNMYSNGVNSYDTNIILDRLLHKYSGQLEKEVSRAIRKVKINSTYYAPDIKIDDSTRRRVK
ncbi:hypothetical protein [Aquimarina sp. 2201CG5-10]|uniref:hypothetical protein n=1 Tax=Aquimarina callyspongiae TaxID=3098150 RepID=UPI002AB49466|nr:hypothetical protein [Aquimarina sp. 2201CG5-10]MDY8137559.1 hypothetical protein [Aquimarina sp. 2201CG5-10]